MAASTIYKPGTYKGPVYLVPSEGPRGSVSITDEEGNVYEGDYLNTNEGRHQYVFPRDLYGKKNLKVTYNGEEGSIPDGSLAYEGFSGTSSLSRRAGGKGDLAGGGGGGIGGAPFGPSSVGDYSFVPGFLGDLFPSPALSNYTPIEAAPYQFTDPLQFAQSYSPAIRDELRKNLNLGREFALQNLDTELQGLQNYVPAAAALKREQISIDNIINQRERQAAVRAALPGAEEDLLGQRARANQYASGRVPDELMDRALELGARSEAAEGAFAGGFGATSAAARNISDVMAVKERLQLSQYGDQLLSKNISQRADILLPPTQYSNVGQEVRSVPEIGAGRQAQQFFSEANQQTVVPATQALSTTVQQNQFTTGQEQQTRQFNASNTLQNEQFNVGNINNFALRKFDYLTGYAAAQAGAAQTNLNTGIAVQQQQRYEEIFKEAAEAARNSATLGSIAQGIGAITTAIGFITDALGIQNPFKKPGQTGQPSTGGGATPGVTPPSSSGSDVVPPSDVPDTSDVDFGGSEPPLMDPDTGAPITEEGGELIERDIPIEELEEPSVAGEDFGEDEITPPEPTSNEDFGGEDFSIDEVESLSASTSPAKSKQASTGPLPNAANFKTLDEIPEDRIAVGRDRRTGEVVTIPISDFERNVETFKEETGIQLTRDNYVEAMSTADSTLSAAGLSNTAGENTVSAGVDENGNQVYSDRDLQNSRDSKTGARYVSQIKQVIEPFKVFNEEDSKKFDKLAEDASDEQFISQLDQAENQKQFSNLVLNKFDNTSIDEILKKPDDPSATSMAFAVGRLWYNWDKMSSGQKGLALASVGLKGYRFASGTDLASYKIITPSIKGGPGLTLGQGLQLLQSGYNAYSLARNWKQYSTLGRITGTAQTVNSIAQTARSMGLLGSGTTGSAVPISAARLASQGWSAAPNAGVGAISAPAGTQVPAGYTVTSTSANGTITAAPAGTSATSVIAGVAGAATFAYGAKQVYDGWGTGGGAGARNGLVGGTAMAAGLYTLGATNPYLLAGVVAVSVAGNAIHTGKPGPQMKRDGMRSLLKKNGLVDGDYNVTLADGTKYNIGADGKNGRHSWTDLSRRGPGQEKRNDLYAYDVDYTNDLDWTSAMAGVSLARITAGGKNTGVDQVGNQLANAAIGNIGFNQKMTRENFTKMSQNMRAMYAKAGIDSLDEAKKLSNRAFYEGRINESDLVAMQTAFDVVFNNNYSTAVQMAQNRWRGLEVAGSVGKESTVRV